jgi:hypothetical protein
VRLGIHPIPDAYTAQRGVVPASACASVGPLVGRLGGHEAAVQPLGQGVLAALRLGVRRAGAAAGALTLFLGHLAMPGTHRFQGRGRTERRLRSLRAHGNLRAITLMHYCWMSMDCQKSKDSVRLYGISSTYYVDACIWRGARAG